MLIQLSDHNGYVHTIDSEDPETIGRWAAEWFEKFLTVNSYYGYNQITIYPQTDKERELIRNHRVFLDENGLRHLGRVFTEAAREVDDADRLVCICHD